MIPVYDSFDWYASLIPLLILLVPLLVAVRVGVARRAIFTITGLYLLALIAPRLALVHLVIWVVVAALVPLVAILALSIGLGFLVAWMLVEGLSYTRTMHAPDARFYLAILGSLALAILSVFAVTGLIRRNTEISQTRFE